MKIGIVVPFSWSFWGGVNEHADQQARALMERGHDVRIIMGNDPPGRLTKLLHPREGRHSTPPEYVLPVGRSVIAPANGSLPNIVLSPSAMPRMQRIFEREGFDLVHVHEPIAPILSAFALAIARCPIVSTSHSAGAHQRWYPLGKFAWGFLMERIDHRLAVSDSARIRSEPYIGGPIEVLPNGVAIPPRADPGGRQRTVVFIGRNDRRKGLEILLRAWPAVAHATGARLRVVGADPLSVRWLMRRRGLSDAGVDLLGSISEEALTDELLGASALVAPSLGGESFGMVLTRAFACATPVVASDIEGYRDVASAETSVLVPPGDPEALVGAISGLFQDERRRRALGEAARALAVERYAWNGIAERLVEIYRHLVRAPALVRAAAR